MFIISPATSTVGHRCSVRVIVAASINVATSKRQESIMQQRCVMTCYRFSRRSFRFSLLSALICIQSPTYARLQQTAAVGHCNASRSALTSRIWRHRQRCWWKQLDSTWLWDASRLNLVSLNISLMPCALLATQRRTRLPDHKSSKVDLFIESKACKI